MAGMIVLLDTARMTARQAKGAVIMRKPVLVMMKRSRKYGQ
jgi:hypothetical protein